MITIANNTAFQIELTVNRGSSAVREDLGRASLHVFLTTPGDRIFCANVESQDNVVMVNVPSGLRPGNYGLHAFWAKNEGHIHDTRCLQETRLESFISLTEYEYEATEEGEGLIVRVQSQVATYGYDGLDAYQLAVVRGKWFGTESEWLDSIGGGGVIIDVQPIPDGSMEGYGIATDIHGKKWLLPPYAERQEVAAPTIKVENVTAERAEELGGCYDGEDIGCVRITIESAQQGTSIKYCVGDSEARDYAEPFLYSTIGEAKIIRAWCLIGEDFSNDAEEDIPQIKKVAIKTVYSDPVVHLTYPSVDASAHATVNPVKNTVSQIITTCYINDGQGDNVADLAVTAELSFSVSAGATISQTGAVSIPATDSAKAYMVTLTARANGKETTVTATVNQTAATWSLSPANLEDKPNTGGTFNVAINKVGIVDTRAFTGEGTSWASVSFDKLTEVFMVQMTVNTTASKRTGTLTLQGKSFNVSQTGTTYYLHYAMRDLGTKKAVAVTSFEGYSQETLESMMTEHIITVPKSDEQVKLSDASAIIVFEPTQYIKCSKWIDASGMSSYVTSSGWDESAIAGKRSITVGDVVYNIYLIFNSSMEETYKVSTAKV